MTVTIKPNMARRQQATLISPLKGQIVASTLALIRSLQTRRAIALLSLAPDLMLKDLGIVRSDIARVVRQGRR